MAKGSLTSKSSNEYEIRKHLIEEDLIDCIVNLPAKLFLNTQIPASLWFIRRDKIKRKKEILFIDARNLGHLINRRNRELANTDIKQIAESYHNWKKGNKAYKDIPGFSCSVSIDKVKELDYILSPGRYVGLPEQEDDFNFAEKFKELKSQLEQQMKEEVRLNKRILKNLENINYNDINNTKGGRYDKR